LLFKAAKPLCVTASSNNVLVEPPRLVSGLSSPLVFVIIGFVKELDLLTGHYGGDGVLVYKLGLAIATQQNAKIVKPRNHALKLDAIDQENGYRGFVFPDVVQKGVLEVFCSIWSHYLSVRASGRPAMAGNNRDNQYPQHHIRPCEVTVCQ
jgi:hypothetical protein